MINLDKLKWIPNTRSIIDTIQSNVTAIIGYHRKTWVFVKNGRAEKNLKSRKKKIEERREERNIKSIWIDLYYNVNENFCFSDENK